jgi:hypothetical protein
MSSYVAANPWSLPGFKRNFYTSGGRLKAAFESPEPLSDEDDSDRVVIVRNLTVLVRLLLWHSEIRGGVGDDEDDELLSSVVSESMGAPFLRLRTKLQAFWGLLLDARREWLLQARVSSPAVVHAAGGAVGGSTRGPFFARRGGRDGGASAAATNGIATRGGLATPPISSVRPSVSSPLRTVTVPSASQTPNQIPAGASREEVRLLELVDRLLDDYRRRGATQTPSQAALARVRTRQAAWDRLASSKPRALLTRYPSLNSTNGMCAQCLSVLLPALNMTLTNYHYRVLRQCRPRDHQRSASPATPADIQHQRGDQRKKEPAYRDHHTRHRPSQHHHPQNPLTAPLDSFALCLDSRGVRKGRRAHPPRTGRLPEPQQHDGILRRGLHDGATDQQNDGRVLQGSRAQAIGRQIGRICVRRELQRGTEDGDQLMMQRKEIHGTTGVLGWSCTDTQVGPLWVTPTICCIVWREIPTLFDGLGQLSFTQYRSYSSTTACNSPQTPSASSPPQPPSRRLEIWRACPPAPV